MSRVCSKCGRGPKKIISRSHSHIATKRWKFVNLQTKRINGKTVKLCSSCIKTGKLAPKKK